MFEDIQQHLEGFFDNLNWTFIFMYVIILYGIKHKREFNWYNNLFSSESWEDLKSWLAGIIVGLLFCFFYWEEGDELNGTYVSQLLRSWVVVLVFNTIFTDKIKKIEKEQ